MSKYRLNVNNAICLFDGFGYWQNPSNKSVGKLKYISAGQSLQFIKLFYREVLLRSLSLNAFFHLDAHSWFAYYLNIRNLWKKRQKSINLFKYKRVTKFKPVDKLCLNLSVKKKSKNVVIRLWSLQRRMRSHAAKKKDRRLFKKFCKHFNIYRWDGTVDYRRFDRYYRWKYRQFHRFNGNVKLFHKYNFSHYLYRKAFWETNTTYVRPLKFRLRRFWRFIIKPFFFWMIYYFNQFFLIYYKVLFVIWIRYLFRKTNVENFIKLYGYSDYFVNKKDVKSFNWFLPFEANITFLATSARKQFYYFNALFGIFRAARKRSFKINHDFFFHFKRYKYKCKRRLFRRRYKFIYIYHQAFKHHLFKTFSISGWRRVLKRLEFRKFIRKCKYKLKIKKLGLGSWSRALMGLPFKKDYTRKYLRYRYRIRELIKPALDIYSKNKVPVTNQVNAYSIAQQRRSSYKYVRHLFKKKDSQYYSKFSNRLYYSNLLGTSVNKYLLRKTGFWKNFISQAPSGYRLRQDVASFQDIWGNRFIKIKRKRKDQGESLIKFFQPGWIARLNNPIKYSNNYRNKSSTFTVNGVRMKHRHIPSTANTQLFLTQADVVAYKNTPINRIKIGTKDKMHDLSQISDEIEQYMSEMAKKGF